MRKYADVKQTAPIREIPVLRDAPIGKECINLLALLSDLYNLRVVSCPLIYDLVREILNDELNEMDVELILKLAKGTSLHTFKSASRGLNNFRCGNAASR